MKIQLEKIIPFKYITLENLNTSTFITREFRYGIMKLRRFLKHGVCGALLIAGAGCYEYPAPPAATLGESYTQRKHDHADELLAGITELRLADAQRIAIANNPTYIAAYHAVNAAYMRYLQSWGAYSPTVSAGFDLGGGSSWTRRTVNTVDVPVRTDRFTTSTTVRADLLLFDGLSRWFSVKIAEAGHNYQKMLEADEARTLMRAVAYAYNTVLLAIENKRIALEDREFQASSLHDTQIKYKAGSVPLSDVLNFEIAVNTAEGNLVEADYQYETAIYALAVLMGYPEGTLPAEIKFPSDFKSNFSDLPSVDVYLDTALANRPDLKGYREQLEVARYQLYQKYSAYSPTVNAYFTAGYDTGMNHYYGGGPSPVHSYSEKPSLSYGISANWMIFNGLIRYNAMRESQANLAIADYKVAAKWMEVVGEVRAAYANYIQAVKQTRLYENTRNLSAKQRDLVADSYHAGNTELTRLNEAQRDLVQAETNLAGYYITVQNAKAQLDAAVSVNTAEYYLHPDETAPGKLEKTPVPGLEGDSNVPADTKTTEPAAAPTNSVIPGTDDGPAPAAPAANTPATPAENTPATPAIPADPQAPPPQTK